MINDYLQRPLEMIVSSGRQGRGVSHTPYPTPR